MRIIIYCVLLVLGVNTSVAQTMGWTRSERDNVYSDCMAYLNNNYPHLSSEQKETMSLCFLEEVSGKYSRENYFNKIDVELKRLRSATVELCAKNHGIVLTNVVKNDTLKKNEPWSKADKDKTYKSCIAYLLASQKDLSQDQRESVCICFSNRLAEKVTIQNYYEMMQAEAKQLNRGAMDECAASNGIDLKMNEERARAEKLSKENLTGHWKDKHENTDFWLYDGGNFTMTDYGKRVNGTWSLHGEILTLTFDKLLGTKQRNYEILLFAKDKFVYQSMKGKSTYTVERIR